MRELHKYDGSAKNQKNYELIDTLLENVGMKAFVEHLNLNKTPLIKKPIYFKALKDNVDVEVAIQYNDSYTETIHSLSRVRSLSYYHRVSHIEYGHLLVCFFHYFIVPAQSGPIFLLGYAITEPEKPILDEKDQNISRNPDPFVVHIYYRML